MIIVAITILLLSLVVGVGWYFWVNHNNIRYEPVIPRKHEDALERTEVAILDKPLKEAVPIVRRMMPGWKVRAFEGSDPLFYKKFDAWSYTGSKPDTVVIITEKGLASHMTFGPSGGKGWTGEDGGSCAELDCGPPRK